jgi:hypothetical protein
MLHGKRIQLFFTDSYKIQITPSHEHLSADSNELTSKSMQSLYRFQITTI